MKISSFFSCYTLFKMRKSHDITQNIALHKNNSVENISAASLISVPLRNLLKKWTPPALFRGYTVHVFWYCKFTKWFASGPCHVVDSYLLEPYWTTPGPFSYRGAVWKGYIVGNCMRSWKICLGIKEELKSDILKIFFDSTIFIICLKLFLNTFAYLKPYCATW